jgi:hypothetical protein
MQTQSILYRAHRLLVRGTAGAGWVVAIRPPGGQPLSRVRNRVPAGLDVLLDEARRQVDRRLDGAPWQRDP